MGMLIGFLVQLLIGGGLLWLSIKVVDGQNTKNTFPAAVGWAFMLALCGVMPFLGGIIGLVVFFMVCFRYYELGVLQAIGVILVQIGIAIGAAFLLAGLAGHHAA